MTRLVLSASAAVLLLAACGGASETAEAEANAAAASEVLQTAGDDALAPLELDAPEMSEIEAEADPAVRLTLLETRGVALQSEMQSRFERYLSPLQAEMQAVAAAMEAAEAEIATAQMANFGPVVAEARTCEGGSDTAPDFTPPEPDEDMSVVEANAMITQALMLAAEASECVYALPTGLRFRIDRAAGEDAAVAEPGEMVQVNYEGKLPNGEIFDSSYERGQPATFPSNGVIAGWVQALGHMREGEQWTLFIPADLGYGPAGRGPIGPNEAMIFKVELIDLPSRPDAAPEAAPEAGEANDG